MPGSPVGPTSPNTTVSQLFQSKRLVQWWSHPTQRFGQGDAFGGGTEQGTDFALPLHTPVGSIAGGKVIVANYTGDASLGYVVQVAAPDGSIWHYQHLASATVRPGQTITAGTVLGQSGGTPGKFSSGPHIEVRHAMSFNPALANGSGVGAAYWSDARWIDPLNAILSTTGSSIAIGGTVPVGANPLTGIGNAIGGMFGGLFSNFLGFASTSKSTLPTSASFTLPPVHIAPTGDVTNFLVAIDAFLEIVNPANVTNATQDTLFGATFTDPISWVEGFLWNIFQDAGAIMWRLFFIVLGVYLIFKVSQHFINYQQLASTATKVVAVGAGV